jgi:hypothetical protein
MAGCGGGSADSKNTIAAKTCEESARTQLGDKTYALDSSALAASAAEQPDGSLLLKGPIVVQPGLAAESKQTLECSVRFVEGKAAPDVLRLQFIW